MNKWGIPAELERNVRKRDTKCVYCRVTLRESSSKSGPRRAIATWEHIINDARIITAENIARCCAPCNSSKGTKKLSVWIDSDYCRRQGIKRTNVAGIIKKALNK